MCDYRQQKQPVYFSRNRFYKNQLYILLLRYHQHLNINLHHRIKYLSGQSHWFHCEHLKNLYFHSLSFLCVIWTLSVFVGINKQINVINNDIIKNINATVPIAAHITNAPTQYTITITNNEIINNIVLIIKRFLPNIFILKKFSENCQ